MFPERWYDGTGWSEDKYLVASHVLLSFAYQGSRGEAAYGTNAQFEKWVKDELLGDTWSKVKNRADEVSTGFEAFSVKTGSTTQVLVSFTWKKGGLKVAKEDRRQAARPRATPASPERGSTSSTPPGRTRWSAGGPTATARS